MTITGLDHVQVTGPPGCERAARRFYGDLLGLTEVRKPEGVRASGGVWFRCGAQELHIGIEEEFAPARKAHPGLGVDGEQSLVALVAVLTGAGVDVQWDERIANVRRCFVTDPWGNRVELRAL
jgi:catechol 2,3-dioxygenase-like lactoylglutathione lyase family enzyme